jgi:hypothetical protein
VRDVGDRIKDGAVSEERSPEKVAILERIGQARQEGNKKWVLTI